MLFFRLILNSEYWMYAIRDGDFIVVVVVRLLLVYVQSFIIWLIEIICVSVKLQVYLRIKFDSRQHAINNLISNSNNNKIHRNRNEIDDNKMPHKTLFEYQMKSVQIKSSKKKKKQQQNVLFFFKCLWMWLNLWSDEGVKKSANARTRYHQNRWQWQMFRFKYFVPILRCLFFFFFVTSSFSKLETEKRLNS